MISYQMSVTNKLQIYGAKWRAHRLLAEAGISKNYFATNSGSPEVELRFCPRLILF